MKSKTLKFITKSFAIIALMAISVATKAQQYVFISNETNGYFLNSSATATQTFTEASCVWICTDGTNETTLGGTSRRLHIGNTYLRGRNSNNANSARTGSSTDSYVGQWRAVDNYLVHYYTANRYVYNNDGTPYWNNSNTRPAGAFGVYTYSKTSDEVFTVAPITGVDNILTTTGTYNLSSAASYTPESYKYTGPDTRYYAPGITTGAVTSNSGLGTKTSGFTSDTWSITPSVTGVSINNNGRLSYTSQVTNDVQITIKHTVTENGKTKSAEKTILFYAATIATPTITRTGNSVALSTTSLNATIYYTTDGTTPTASSTPYTSSIDLTSLTLPVTIKAVAIRNGNLSSVSSKEYQKLACAQPIISIASNGDVTITAESGTTIYYTTNGDAPTTSSSQYSASFTVTNETVVKAIAVKSNWDNSPIASAQYLASGVSGGKVILNDYEDHNWSYYSDPESPVKNLDPINVKITYKGGSVNNASAVAVSATESANTFVYYKTIEKGTTVESTGFVDEYSYYTIPNPFSKRPRTTGSTGTNGYFGFNGWQITKIVGGTVKIGTNTYNAGTNLTINVAADTKIIFTPATQTVNGTDMEIEMTARWDVASVITCNAAQVNNYLNSTNLTSGSYERNFIVVTGGTSNTDLTAGTSKPVTITMVTPDGATDYRASGVYISPATITLSNDWKFEYINIRSNNTVLNANAKNLVLGRGIARDDGGTGYCVTTIHGFYGGTFNNPNYRLRMESGVYNNVYFTNGQTNNTTVQGQGTLDVDGVVGCDYDRATNTNNKLRTNNPVYMGDTRAMSNNYNNTTNDKRETFRLTVKSGDIGYGIANTENTYAMEATLYIAHKATGNASYLGRRVLVVEGGIISAICGGRDATSGNNSSNSHYMANLVRMKGGIVRGPVYLGAANAAAYNDRYFIMTGGQVKGWVAGGCNGNTYSNGGGKTIGESFMYIGGTARVGADDLTNTIGDCERGTLMGAGDGRTSYAADATCGELTYGTNVVVADQCTIDKNVYGGGNYGYSKAASHIFISGGTVEGSVFGGANNREGVDVSIHMKGGLVKGGIYGGSNANGTISENVSIQINGGQIGTSTTTANVHGGGFGQPTRVTGNVDVTLGTITSGVTAGSAVIYGDVYGGSALGYVNGTATSTTKHTNVTLNGGDVYGAVYGGGLGDGSNAANVYAPVKVTINGGSATNVFGCNNTNGRPMSTVNVNMTGGLVRECVYGGGNAAGYTGTPHVAISGGEVDKHVFGGGLGANAVITGDTDVKVTEAEGATTLIKGNVYGGGNAAAVTGNTKVTIGE